MNITTLRKIAKLLNDNHIQYRIEPYSFLGETLVLSGAGFSITIADGDYGHLKVKRRTKSAKALETIKDKVAETFNILK